MSLDRDPVNWKSVAILGAIIAALFLVRGPVIARQPGGQDEEYYAFPGLTIVRDGIPRLPHVPQRDPERVFFRADVAFFAEPPLFFYVQAAFYALLPATYGTARVASLVSGAFAVLLVCVLARRWYRDESIALWSAGLYSLSRLFYFPAITARPDMLCTALGLGAIWAFDVWRETKRRRWFIAAGVLLGFGGLTHPFALVYAVQLAAWAAWSERGWRRLNEPVLLAGTAIVTCLLWLPLIATYPEEFRTQFVNNILHPAGPGLLARMLAPWGPLAHHATLVWERAAPLQFGLLAAAIVVAAVGLSRHRDGGRKPVLFAVSSVYLISVMVGLHPGHGYWSYAAAFFTMCLASVIVNGWRLILGAKAQYMWLSLPAAVLVICMMIPGLGLRTWWAYVTHWNNIEYDAPRFAEQIMDDLPAEARYTVGVAYVLDFYAAGRETLIGETSAFYLESKDFPYDYLVISHDGLAEELPDIMNAQLLRAYGDRDDPFACYAEVYVPRTSEDQSGVEEEIRP